jgi:hypothetical protein
MVHDAYWAYPEVSGASRMLSLPNTSAAFSSASECALCSASDVQGTDTDAISAVYARSAACKSEQRDGQPIQRSQSHVICKPEDLKHRQTRWLPDCTIRSHLLGPVSCDLRDHLRRCRQVEDAFDRSAGVERCDIPGYHLQAQPH